MKESKFTILDTRVTILPRKLAALRDFTVLQQNIRVAELHEKANKSKLNGIMPWITGGQGAN